MKSRCCIKGSWRVHFWELVILIQFCCWAALKRYSCKILIRASIILFVKSKSLSCFLYRRKISRLCLDLPVFPLRPNIIIGSLTQYQLIPFQRIYLKCYLNLTNPKCPEVYLINSPEFCHIDTCSKKIQSEIIMQIKTLLRATFKNW